MTAAERYPNLKVPCPNEDLGCPWKGFLKDLDDHTIPCEKKLFRAALIDIHMMKAKLENKDREIHYLKNDFEIKIRKIEEERITKKKEKLEKVRDQTEKIGEIVYAKMEEIKEEHSKQKEEIDNLKKEVAELKKEKDDENKNFQSELQELRNENQKLKSQSSKELEHKVTGDSVSSPTSESSQQSGLVTTLPQNPTPPPKASKVFLEMCVDGTNEGRIVIDLFYDKAPNTCDKFSKLCNNNEIGVTYKGSEVGNVTDELCAMGNEGDLTYPSSSSKEFPPQFQTPAENLSDKHNTRGIVSMCAYNSKDLFTKSYFMIMFKPSPRFDGGAVIIGKVTEETWPVCERIKKLECGGEPKQCITISNCGMVE